MDYADPIQTRHEKIQQHKIRLYGLDPFQKPHPILGSIFYFQPCLLEVLSILFCKFVRIIGNQNF